MMQMLEAARLIAAGGVAARRRPSARRRRATSANAAAEVLSSTREKGGAAGRCAPPAAAPSSSPRSLRARGGGGGCARATCSYRRRHERIRQMWRGAGSSSCGARSPAAAAVVLVRRARLAVVTCRRRTRSTSRAGAARPGVWAPTVPFAEGVGPTQLTATANAAWASAEEVSHYELQARYGAGEGVHRRARLGQRRATISSPQPGAAYWCVRAAARDGRSSEFSQSVAPAPTAPPAPEAFPSTAASSTSLWSRRVRAHHELQWRPHARGPARRCGWGGGRAARASGTTVAKRNSRAACVGRPARARSPMRGCCRRGRRVGAGAGR